MAAPVQNQRMPASAPSASPPLSPLPPQPPPPPSVSMASPAPPAQQTVTDNILCCSTPFDLIVPCNACFVVPERSHMVQLFLGSYHGTITQPGFYCRSSLVIELRAVATHLISIDLQNTKVLDARGSPVLISGIVTYAVTDARAAAIDVSDPHQYVRDQAPAILKRIVAMYPYEADEGGGAAAPSLRSETAEIAARMRDALQQRCAVAGVTVETFSINELSYAPEIAATMLRRQQADALISARKSIVMGAKEIAKETVEDVGSDMTMEQKATLLSNLLIVLVGDKDVSPTMQL